ncbi:MAG: hypothetical protein ACLRQX_04280 [Turicibacter sanguinis]
MPNKIVKNIPHIYDEFFKNKNGFKDRKDILFVGGFNTNQMKMQFYGL